MAKNTVQTSVKKTYSNAEVLQLSNKTLTILQRDAENGCLHCITILREIFYNKEGTGPSNETQSLTQNHTPQDTTHRRQVLKIGKSKNNSAASY